MSETSKGRATLDGMEVAPCPFCGHDTPDGEWTQDRDGEQRYYVECPECWATGPVRQSAAEAVESWNHKVLAQPPESGEPPSDYGGDRAWIRALQLFLRHDKVSFPSRCGCKGCRNVWGVLRPTPDVAPESGEPESMNSLIRRYRNDAVFHSMVDALVFRRCQELSEPDVAHDAEREEAARRLERVKRGQSMRGHHCDYRVQLEALVQSRATPEPSEARQV